MKVLLGSVLVGFIVVLTHKNANAQSSIFDPIKDALYLHNFVQTNNTLQDCVFRPANAKDMCPDPDIRYILYSNGQKQVLDHGQTDWLRQSIWDPLKEDLFLVHGYAGGDDALPMNVLRDAYIRNGSYNVWIVDWGALGEAPCYRAAVTNMRAVARCTGELLTSLRIAGLPTEKLTCVGHSLGSHVCGLISKYVMFRMHRIVALDPARPLITNQIKLNVGDAAAVHVLHTNAGHYGEGGRGGHVDFCINGGRIQPYCENADIDAQLCSHIWAICYMAESIDPRTQKKAEPCSRRCPSGPVPARPINRVGIPVFMGQNTPLTAAGSYCVHDSQPPYCPKKPGDAGDVRCCLKPPSFTQQ
ncbi:phospholipase A1 member A-like [Anthonomus grandis grandis]|uniref:phospholipase A1 member A-like n=1 Tax=Anthonomus grandis grandis TaxID=2921223 RepID=UPI0021669470|nr:phospholipase A1 member A-like [Anthonomus grandis grandis]